MNAVETLQDAFERLQGLVHHVTDGLSADQLAARLDDEANTIAWLVWHLTRIQDDHVAGLDDGRQRWTTEGWVDRFALPLDPDDTGYGHDPEMVSLVIADARLLLDYYEDVHQRTLRFLATLSEDDLERVVDERWDPPVTVRIRLVSVIADDLQHVGQAAYVRGIVQRR
jgi:hypothetical protein